MLGLTEIQSNNQPLERNLKIKVYREGDAKDKKKRKERKGHGIIRVTRIYPLGSIYVPCVMCKK